MNVTFVANERAAKEGIESWVCVAAISRMIDCTYEVQYEVLTVVELRRVPVLHSLGSLRVIFRINHDSSAALGLLFLIVLYCSLGHITNRW
jgi:hypothetical protein